MDQIPIFVHVLFVLTTACTLVFLYLASSRSWTVLLLSLCWLTVTGGIGLTGFYTVNNTFPPRLTFLLLPGFLVLLALMATNRGKAITHTFDLKWLNYLHVVRVPVEIVLYCLFVYRQVPEIMTFEGRNFDILAGVSAPLVAWLGYTRKRLSRMALLGWNLLSLGLVLNIVMTGILSVQTPFQQFGFEQPNRALAFFPFVWLPGFIVPVVLFSHLVSIRRLWKKNEESRIISAAGR